MAKYKIGDKVIVRSDLDEDTEYYMDDKSDYWYPEEEMVALGGKVITIKDYKSGSYYLAEETSGDCFWTDEMFVGLEDGKEETPLPKKEEPKGFKVGDRVKFVNGHRYGNLKYGDIGTVISDDNDCGYDYGVEFDNECNGHNCDGHGKPGHCFWVYKDQLELIQPEPTPEPIPTPTPINVNITVNLYENSCWYCRKGGLVDLYLAGAMGICPSCKRVCNATNALPKAHKPNNPWKKENRALTREEFDALPVGTKVYILWRWDSSTNSKRTPKWGQSGWGVKKETQCVWKDPNERNCNQNNRDYDRCFDAYLEEPERP